MRIGFIGPAEGDHARLREAAEFLLGDLGADQAIYLGADSAVAEVVQGWAREIMGEPATLDAFLDRAHGLALRGKGTGILGLLAKDRELEQLDALRTLPAAPARAVEVVDDKVMLFVHDKSHLDEDDIANAFLVVYGKAKQSALNRFGPRSFFTPGPLRSGRVGLLERSDDGSVLIAQFDPSTGEPAGRETLMAKRTRFMVQS